MTICRISLTCVLLLILSVRSQAQHEGHPAPAPKPTPSTTSKPASKPAANPTPRVPETKPVTAQPSVDHSSHGSMDMGPVMVMDGDDMFIRFGDSEVNPLPMGRMGSGTSWQPASTEMNMLHKQAGEWLVMFHYNATIGINSQGGPRGATKFPPFVSHRSLHVRRCS